MTRRTKIVATIGPASESPEVLRALVEEGVDVVRLNLSHGDVADHLQRLADIREVSADVGRPVAVLADLPGPKIRSGAFPDGGAILPSGSSVRLVPGDGPSDDECISVDYEHLLSDLRTGCTVQLGDGAIAMVVDEIADDHAVATVRSGGRANGSPGVHLPSDTMRLSTPTDEDLTLAEKVAAAGVEYLAVSFVRRAEDLAPVREVVGDRARLVAKIETATAVDHLDSIVDAADAVMVARGDLGIDCPIEDVPHLQKRIIRHCVEVGVPVITATQMLESMINSPAPTRAEVTDVANAVFDGTDAVMLSGETAIGIDPVAVVHTMGEIAERAEAEASYRGWASRLAKVQRDWHTDAVDGEPAHRIDDRITMALTHAASEAAIDIGATAILCCTHSGRTARAMARFRPSVPMIGLSPDPSMVRSMSLSWGVVPVEVDRYSSTDEMVWFAVEVAIGQELVERGDTVLVLAGAPSGRDASTATNVLRIVRVA